MRNPPDDRQRPGGTPRGAALAVRDEFDAWHHAFRASAHRMARCFERCDWGAISDESATRLRLYGQHVLRALVEVETHAGQGSDHDFWVRMRGEYAELVEGRPDEEIARTFFSSVTRVAFDTVGVNNAIEFHRLSDDGSSALPEPSCARAFPVASRDDLARVAREIVDGIPHRFADAAGDAAVLAHALRERAGTAWDGALPERISLLPDVLYRGRAAHVIGRMSSGSRTLPVLIALRGTPDGARVDALLTSADEISIVFGFAWSYFHVDVARPREAVAFLSSLMPLKRVDELYTSLGYHKHGKTELYRELTEHLAQSDARFELADGTPGLVMSVITLPSFSIVLKLIKDRIGAPKRTTRNEVMGQYRRVFLRDRVGRLADAQLFQGLAFPRRCFSDDLLRELVDVAPSVVRVEGDRVSIAQLYTQRRVRPLNLYLEEVPEPEADAAILDYGRAIKELAAANIFTGDLLLKNFGVSRHGRVIFYDYDELATVTECQFRRMPVARNDDDELSAEPWYHVGENDVFPEELLTFMVPPGRLRDVFLSEHADLFDADWWIALQERLRSGEQPEVLPYQAERRLGS
jgi:isocitrate dehydrogenase kinase/phosphatase